MDESYQVLLESERKRRQASGIANAQRVARSILHKLLVGAIVVAFRARRAIDKAGAGARRILLFPLDLGLSLCFTVWARNPSCATSTHLDLTALRQAFWEGDSLVVATGWRTFFIKRKCVEVPVEPAAAAPTPMAMHAPPAPCTAASVPRKRRRPNRTRWRFRRRPMGRIDTSILRSGSTLTTAALEQTIQKGRFQQRRQRLRNHFKRTSGGASGGAIGTGSRRV